MESQDRRYRERHGVKTKIIATVGPAVESLDMLRSLVEAGVDIFRLNFAHGSHEWLATVVARIRNISEELQQPLALLGDLSGPKIRLGELPNGEINCREGDIFTFVEKAEAGPQELTSTYDRLIDDLSLGDSVLLADGTVRMIVTEKNDEARQVVCRVAEGGPLRSRQGINLPGVILSTPSLTDKDLEDLDWALTQELDFLGLSFVRSADDVKKLKDRIEAADTHHKPQVVAKIEKLEAVDALEEILDHTDAVMVARGDLGVEADIVKVPTLQKQIIKLCNQHRIPVITATQMLDSMQHNERPTRAEASDVANAILDGTDAIMLSGESAIGKYPIEAVSTMSRIAREAERHVTMQKFGDTLSEERTRARLVTEGVTLAASTAAEHLNADLMVVATHSGKTAMAISKQRSPVTLLALTDQVDTSRRMCLYWGVAPLMTHVVEESPEQLLNFVVEWGKANQLLQSGSRIVLIGSTKWSAQGHDMMLVHAVK
ncbi:pyruvate kinase [Planctomycetaceae bacterium]|jgi:pyruvate kinase|nr:pyruvate kinase [Planctomycetaceae bacterium]MDG2391251.1 pyruvate kinase [Planctomycetaceae bacterium]